ncbi:MAG: DUF1080 domain-containing protein [Armatimonadetes bacterium]|nr:DUF1080 domain-containing protein [Armatimonadota bacterium]
MSLWPLLLVLAGVQSKAPKGAVVLFDGTSTKEWVHRGTGKPCEWDIVEGALVVKQGTPDILTKREFGDYRLHLEFWLPLMADQTSQGRANSGVYNHGRYEIQILDSFKNPTDAFGDCGAIYGEKEPDQYALLPPERWNTYDIVFRAPRFKKDGTVSEKPRITVDQNGIRIHTDVEIRECPTRAGLDGPQPKTGPILLQDHGAPVRYRNIWILPLKLK